MKRGKVLCCMCLLAFFFLGVGRGEGASCTRPEKIQMAFMSAHTINQRKYCDYVAHT